MTSVMEMIRTYPADMGRIDKEALATCIEECFACAQACTACADACLSEKSVADLAKCIRTNLDCADICVTTGNVLSRHTGYDANLTHSVLTTCAQACKTCAEECERHASMGMGMQHCRVCAEACRRCEQACQQLLASLG